MPARRKFEYVKGKCMSLDISSLLGAGSSTGVSSTSSSSSSETEEADLLAKIFKELQAAAEEKKAEINAMEESKRAEQQANKEIDMTKNVNLSSSTIDALLKSSETEER